MEINICRRCEKPFLPSAQEYLCGYGKCSACCGECMHRPHRNPNFVNRDALKKVFEKALKK